MSGRKTNGLPTYATSKKPFVGETKDEHLNGMVANGASSYDDLSEPEVQRVTVLRDVTTQATTKYSKELSFSHRKLLNSENSVEEFLDFVASLRLRHMPHRGSKWDRVLQWAEFFSSSVHHYHVALQGFVHYSEEAARLIWGSSRVLLELGPQHLDLLTKAFAMFYNTGLTLSYFVNYGELFSAGRSIQQTLATAFADLLRLVTEVTVYYASSSLTSAADFDVLFGRTADAFFAHKGHVSDAFWNCKLEISNYNRVSVSIQDIRRFLSPKDRIVELLLSNRLGSRSRREEYTCEWFDSELGHFTSSQDKVFLITGRSGCGKSVLSEWIVERLRRQQGRSRYDVLSFSIEGDITIETSSLSVAKNLLLQLFDNRVGNLELYEHVDVLTTCPTQDNSTIENALWDAIEVGLEGKRTMIVVDGLDQLTGGDEASVKLLNRLHQITSKRSTAKAVVLSQPLKKSGCDRSRLFTIESKHIQEDLTRVIRSSVDSSFPRLSMEDRSAIIERVVSSADGSFAQATLILETVKRENTLPGIMQTLDNAPKTPSEAVQKLLSSLDFQQKDTRSLLAWLLAAQRPLTLGEIKELLALDTTKATSVPRFSDTEYDVRSAVGPLIRIQDGVVRFTHLHIRQQLLEMAASIKDFSNTDARFPFNLQEAHYDLVTKCLAYAKISFTENIASSIEPVSHDKLIRIFQRHVCLEYTVRYWALNFLNSPMYQKDGKHKITGEFKKAFPSSAALAVLEYTCWDSQTTTPKAAALYEFALHLRQTIAGDQPEAIFQTLVAIARIYERMSGAKDASIHYHLAYNVGRPIFGQSSSVIAAVVTSYIHCTQSITFTTRDETVNIREEMLQYLISYLKHTRGASDMLTIKYTRIQAELYQQVKEVDRAIELQRDLYQMCIEHHGRQHSETTSIYKNLIQLLKMTGRTEELTQYELSSYESARHTLSLTDYSLITAALNIVSYYESLQHADKGEQVMVELWQSISQAAQSRKLSILQERKIQIALEYVKFLERHQRSDHAQSVLIGLWSDYESIINQTTQISLLTETTLTSLLTIGRKLQQTRSLVTAKSVFSSLWSYYKRTEQQASEVAIEAAVSLSQTTMEIVQITQSSSTVVTQYDETLEEEMYELEEVFESVITLSSAMTTTFSNGTVTSSQKGSASLSTQSSAIITAETLSTIYVRQERWSDAINVITKALQVAWSTVVNGGKTVLPSRDYAVAITAAKRLALCYFKQRQTNKAEQIHIRIFEACKVLDVQDNLFITAANELVEFYETTYQFDKAVEVLSNLYTLLKTNLKPNDAITIRTAYRIAKFCRELQKIKDAEKYFFEIVTALDDRTDVLQWDAIEAALALCSIHMELQQWEAARYFYSVLWKTFLAQAETYSWTENLVEDIFYGYFKLLDEKLKVEYKTLLQVTAEFRDKSVKVFGESHELSTKATLQLASVYERSEQHREQAISTYENAFSSTSTTSIVQIRTIKKITLAKRRLAHLYASQTSTSTKAISLYSEEYKKTASQHGYASRQSIEQLSKLIASYSKESTQELINQAAELLRTSVDQIALTEKDSQKVFDSAQSIARFYLQLNLREAAVALLRDLRQRVIVEEYDSKNAAERHSLAFIVAFEEALHGATSHSLFSELMATLMTERMLFQNYVEAVKTQAKFEVIFSHGSRLALFYKQKQRSGEYQIIETELFKRFAAVFQASETSKVLREFFNICIKEMGKNEQDDVVVSTSSNDVLKYIEASKFKEAYELALFIHKFLQLYDGYCSQQNFELTFKLCLWVAGRGTRKCSDKKLHQQMLALSASMLQEVLEAIQRLKIKFTELSLSELNELVGLLADHQNYEALEMVLSSLWSSRHSQVPWPPAVMVEVGKRLVEVRFILPGRREQAIHLAEDITYNLRRVWATTDSTTLEMFCLLAGLYTADGNYRSAMAVHELILRETLVAVEEDGALPAEDGARIAVTHLELLKRAYLRLGGWDKDAASYANLITHLKEAFHAEEAWASNATANQGIEWNATKEKPDDLGVWKQPASFEFLSNNHKMKHENNLRRTSGLLAGAKYRNSNAFYSAVTSSKSNGTSIQTPEGEEQSVQKSYEHKVESTVEYKETFGPGPVGGVQAKVAIKKAPEEALKETSNATVSQ